MTVKTPFESFENGWTAAAIETASAAQTATSVRWPTLLG
jgi:hypothetical protein